MQCEVCEAKIMAFFISTKQVIQYCIRTFLRYITHIPKGSSSSQMSCILSDILNDNIYNKIHTMC